MTTKTDVLQNSLIVRMCVEYCAAYNHAHIMSCFAKRKFKDDCERRRVTLEYFKAVEKAVEFSKGLAQIFIEMGLIEPVGDEMLDSAAAGELARSIAHRAKH